MKKRGVIITSLIILAMVIFTVDVVFNSLTGSRLIKTDQILQRNAKPNIELISANKCSSTKELGISDVSDEHLKALALYEEKCNSFLTDELMIFIDMPKDTTTAKANAEKLAKTLVEFKEKDVHPLVIVEPVSEWGLIDFNEFDTGFYDTWIKEFFIELQAQGITDETMGTWVPFPEANLPLWNHTNATPEDYSSVVNKYLKILKKYYPKTHTSILLNSATYDSDDFNWANGEYISLLQYVSGIEDGLVDSFGLQGFPWISSRGDESGAVFNADEFLNPQIAIEAANELGVNKIWLNTGTFGAKYTIDPTSTVYVSSSRRKDLLNGILSVGKKLKQEGFDVSINIFAEDKSGLTEATDWSYLPDSFSKDIDAMSVFAEFSAKAESEDIKLTIFDKVK